MPPRNAAVHDRRDAPGDSSDGRGDRLTGAPAGPSPSASAAKGARRGLFAREKFPKAPFEAAVVLVDLDGTLVDSEDINHKAFVQIFREFHLEDKIGTVFEGLAGGLDFATIMAQIGVDAKARDLMTRRMEEIVSAAHLHVLPRAPEAIRALKKRGVKFSIVTLNVSKKALEILRTNRMDDLFERELIVGSDSLPWEKPNPKVVFEVLRRSGRSRAIVVGNAPRDVMLAKNCDLPIVYLKQTMPKAKSIPHDEDAIRVFEARVRELEQRYDHRRIHWANSWEEIPGIVAHILTAE